MEEIRHGYCKYKNTEGLMSHGRREGLWKNVNNTTYCRYRRGIMHGRTCLRSQFMGNAMTALSFMAVSDKSPYIYSTGFIFIGRMYGQRSTQTK